MLWYRGRTGSEIASGVVIDLLLASFDKFGGGILYM